MWLAPRVWCPFPLDDAADEGGSEYTVENACIISVPRRQLWPAAPRRDAPTPSRPLGVDVLSLFPAPRPTEPGDTLSARRAWRVAGAAAAAR